MKPFTKLPNFAKNYYFLFGLFFIIWMAFVDSNGFSSQYQLTKKLNDLESEKEYYLAKKSQVLQDRQELTTNKELLEKFARERYLMKKSSEDLYVIVTED
jgi:cell division protein FtsB